MKTIVFRCDSLPSIGTGHLFRCRNLALFLKSLGFRIIFISRPLTNSLSELLQKDFELFSLPSLTSTSSLPESLSPSFSQTNDAFETASCLSVNNISNICCVVVDHYSLDIEWHLTFLSVVPFTTIAPLIFVIDDLFNRKHYCQLLLDQNNPLGSSLYFDLVPPHCEILSGPKYALLSPEYPLLHSLLPVRTALSRLLIYFGSTDPYNYIPKVLNQLSLYPESHLFIDLVLPANHTHLDYILSLSRQIPFHCSTYTNLKTLAGLMSRADASIGSAGFTSWERICLGLPSVVLSQALNQQSTLDFIHAERLAIKSNSDNCVSDLFGMNLEHISTNCLNYIVGNGTALVADKLITLLQ